MPSLTMPNIGEGVTEGEIVRWLKQVGDPIARDEPVVEIETDKAIVEIPSPYEGTLTTILAAEGETVPIGAAIAEITAVDSSASEPAPAAPPHRAPHLCAPTAPPTPDARTMAPSPSRPQPARAWALLAGRATGSPPSTASTSRRWRAAARTGA